LYEREDNMPEEALFEGVPEHLLRPLVRWCWENWPTDLLLRVALRLRVSFPAGINPKSPGEPVVLTIWSHFEQKQEVHKLLAVADMLLHEAAGDARDHALWFSAVERLNDTLELAGSAYRVSDEGSGLERRVDETAQDALRRAKELAQSPGASHYLSEAWRAAYGLAPDASKAYSLSIKAVEAAATPIVTPQNPKQTLGSMIKDMEQKPSKWRFSLPGKDRSGDVQPVIRMMATLWDGQTDRHGEPNPQPISTDHAEAAIHLAVTLVQWFSSGTVRARQGAWS
jgi:hypothetical protein